MVLIISINLENMPNFKFIKNKKDIGVVFSNYDKKKYDNKEDITKNFDIHINFSSFSENEDIIKLYNKKDCLVIFVDNSYEITNEEFIKNNMIAFIDHHLTEETYGDGSTSNAGQITDNVELIYKFLSIPIYSKVIPISDIYLFIHTDVDGICSGLLITKMLQDLISCNIDNIVSEMPNLISNFINTTSLISSFGDYGDVSEDAIYRFMDSSIYDLDQIKTLDKKYKVMIKNISRFFKILKPVINNTINYETMQNILKTYDININDVIDFYKNKILKSMITPSKINNQFFVYYINNIVTSPFFKNYIDIITKDINRLTDILISEDNNNINALDMMGCFSIDTSRTIYKLIIIDSPFDIGRNVMYSYKAKIEYNKISTGNKYSYKLGDMDSFINLYDSVKNIMCYNISIHKISIMSENDSAYNISAYFNGGGHKADDMSMGSFDIGDISEILKFFIPWRIF